MPDLNPTDAVPPAPEPTPWQAGDAARDRGDWPAAAAAYEACLARHPDLGGIWVQLGHARKELDDLAAAREAYARAAALDRRDPDPHLHLGHVAKLRGDRDGAIGHYADALRRAPAHGDALEELLGLGRPNLARALSQGPGAAPGARIHLDVSDLLLYLLTHATPSGIQRVQIGLVEQALGMPAAQQPGFTFMAEGAAALHAVPAAAMAAITALLDRDRTDHDALRRLIEETMQAAAEARLHAGDVLFLSGAFWARERTADLLLRLREQGVAIGGCIYDLIPVTHPEFFDGRLVGGFRRSLGECLPLFDFALAISDYTARTLRQVIAEEGLPEIPVLAVPLAHTLTALPAAGTPDSWSAATGALRGSDFVLCVGTIEPRKNHAALLAAWKRLLDEGFDPPLLVLVGRRGWLSDDLLAQIGNSGRLGGRVRVLHDVSSRELGTLYRHCLFTVFPSIVEGWGLPVGESLAHGKPCIASSAASIPEVGPGFVDLVDPLDIPGLAARIRDHAGNPEKLRAWQDRIRRDFVPRGWSSVADEMLGAIARLGGEAADPPAARTPLLPAGDIFRPQDFAAGAAAPASLRAAARRLILRQGWHAPEERAGAWMAGRDAALRLRTGAPGGMEIVLFLQMLQPDRSAGEAEAPQRAGGALHLLANGAEQDFALPARPGRFHLRLAARTGQDGGLDLMMRCPAAGAVGSDARSLGLCLQALAWCPAGDAAMRARIVEDLLLDPIAPVAQGWCR